MPVYPALSPSTPLINPATVRSQPYTKLPLDRFARIVNYSPMLFHQVYVTELQPDSSCSDPVLQYTWQPRGGGRPGRDEIALAIQQAETALESELHFNLIPTWMVDDAATPSIPSGWFMNPYPYNINVRANTRHILYGGIEAWSIIQADASIVYSDIDGDGYTERATVTVATTVTDINEIAVYYPGQNHDPGWEIRPIRVAIASGTATIIFERHLAVQPALLEELDAAGVNGLDNANFLTTVDVYRRYNDPSQMAIVEWSPEICTAAGAVISAHTAALTPILQSRDGLFGLQSADWSVTDAEWAVTNPTWWRKPDRVRLWYRAGYRDTRLTRSMHEMAPQLERAVTYLALSYLDREWATCEYIRSLQSHWRMDLAQAMSSPVQSVRYSIANGLLNNPFGTTRAAVYAWRVVQRMVVGEAVYA